MSNTIKISINSNSITLEIKDINILINSIEVTIETERASHKRTLCDTTLLYTKDIIKITKKFDRNEADIDCVNKALIPALDELNVIKPICDMAIMVIIIESINDPLTIQGSYNHFICFL